MPRRQKTRNQDNFIATTPPRASKPGRDALEKLTDHALAFAVDLPRRAMTLAVLGALTGVAAAKSVSSATKPGAPKSGGAVALSPSDYLPIVALVVLGALILKAPRDARVAGGGTLLGFGVLTQTNAALVAGGTGLGCLCPPLGAVAVLLFCLPTAPASQPRAVVVGHAVSSVAALCVVVAKPALTAIVPKVIGAPGLAATLAVVAMKVVGAVHPPAAAYAFLFAMQGWGLKELLAPGLLGAGILVGVQKAYFALMEPAPKKAA